MVNRFGELAAVEGPALSLLGELGYSVMDAAEETFGAPGSLGRDSTTDVVLVHRLRTALERLNPAIPELAREEALAELVKDRTRMDRVRANKAVHTLARDGCQVSWRDDDGNDVHDVARFIDFRHPEANEWVAASQVRIAGELHNRRPDTILYVNGIPLVLFEFKAPHKPVKSAYDDNLSDYRDTIPALFDHNAFVLLSNGSEAKVGATFAPWEFFGDWKVIDSEGNRGVIALETAIRGTCTPERLLDLIENFVAYMERPGGLIKIVARNHQFLGVNAAIENLHRVRAAGEKRLGVFWHTQGSGKSLSMLWFTQKVLRQIAGSWTFVMVTDRSELDSQLHGEFADAGAIAPQAQVHADTSAHLRELLAADHRYVFTLIHKFRLDKAAGEQTMPVLSDRSDVIVITDEAHRSQYDTLALNMRQALPNAAFMGFTGTPLIQGEELTREQFGDYVSIYDFSDAIKDGATVPLYYENRIPELQIVNDGFAEELGELLEAAEVDEETEGQLARRFGREYTLLTRPERLRTIAQDLVHHFVGRGFTGKAMYVGLDKAAAVRMYDYVQDAWAEHLAELLAQHDALPVLERPWLASRIELMQTTDMAVVVSQGQNELAQLQDIGLDIRSHRSRMVNEDLAEKFKDPKDQLRLVFVCAMWMTGFDAPSVSTIYLDRMMRNHTLMQTIARANRVFPDKDNGLIVDYIGVFRNLEKALAIYGAANSDGGDSPIQDVESLVGELDLAVDTIIGQAATSGVDIIALRDASGFEHIALRDAAVEALLVDETTRTSFMASARKARKLFKALLPDPAAAGHQATIAAVRSVAARITEVTRPPGADIAELSDAVEELLDRSVGAEEYVIRAAAEGSQPDPLIDLSQIDFAALAATFAGRKRAETDRLASLLKERATGAARRNPTRQDLVEKIEDLIARYNAGSFNIDEYLRRLIELSQSLSAEEQRAVIEDLDEDALAIFDLLTDPEPELTEEERSVVKQSAKELLAHLHDKLVLDWRRRAETMAGVKTTIRGVLDRGLPEDPYPPGLFEEKVDAIFDHIVASYGDDGSSVYDADQTAPIDAAGVTTLANTKLDTMVESFVEQLRNDSALAAAVATQLGFGTEAPLRTIQELIDNDEDFAVEFKSTARWDLQDGKPNKAMEDAVVKTVAGFLNTDGGTLLIGVDNRGVALGLKHDYGRVRPKNGDGFVNWLTTHLSNALGQVPTTRVRARIVEQDGNEICRVDVAPTRQPVFAKTSKSDEVFFVRMNNSSRAMAAEDVAAYTLEREA
jgi:type I restriction enzyme R subunit